MNKRGEVIHKAIEQIDSYNVRGKSWLDNQKYFELRQRVDKLLCLSYVLANRDKIKVLFDRNYVSLDNIDIVESFVPETWCGFFEPCFLTMGFGKHSTKDIETKDLDYSLYVDEVRELVKEEISRLDRSVKKFTNKLF